MMALVGTLAVVLSLTIYAMTTKKDFTMMGGAFSLFIMSFFLLGIFNWFFRTPLADALLFCAGCMMEGFYLIWDIQMICGQKRGKFGIDDYIRASLNLYIDIIRIFIKIL